MKSNRQNVILSIIAKQDIETQNHLLEALEKHGIQTTQATLSRDIRDMRLVKELGPKGNYRYVAASKQETPDLDQRLKKIFKDVEKLNKVLGIVALIGTGLFMALMLLLLWGN